MMFSNGSGTTLKVPAVVKGDTSLTPAGNHPRLDVAAQLPQMGCDESLSLPSIYPPTLTPTTPYQVVNVDSSFLKAKNQEVTTRQTLDREDYSKLGNFVASTDIGLEKYGQGCLLTAEPRSVTDFEMLMNKSIAEAGIIFGGSTTFLLILPSVSGIKSDYYVSTLTPLKRIRALLDKIFGHYTMRLGHSPLPSCRKYATSGDVIRVNLIIVGGARGKSKAGPRKPYPQVMRERTPKKGASKKASDAPSGRYDPLLKGFASGYRALPPTQKPKTPPGMQAPRFSKCVTDFVRAVMDPSHPEASDICLPDGTAESSYKMTARLNCTVTAGPDGYAAYAVCPSLAKEFPFLFYTNGTASTGGIIEPVLRNVETGDIYVAPGWTAAYMNTDVSIDDLYMVENPSDSTDASVAQFVQPVKGRIVTFGLTTQCTAPVQNMSGVALYYTSPTHLNLEGATFDSLSSVRGAVVCRNDGGVCKLVDTVRNSEERNFSVATVPASSGNLGMVDFVQTQLIYPYACNQQLFSGQSQRIVIDEILNTPSVFSSGSKIGNGNGAITSVFITKATPGNTWYVTCDSHHEYCGARFSAKSTPSHSDVEGLNTVLTAVARAPAVQNATQKSWPAALWDTIVKVASDKRVQAAAIDTALMLGKMIL